MLHADLPTGGRRSCRDARTRPAEATVVAAGPFSLEDARGPVAIKTFGPDWRER